MKKSDTTPDGYPTWALDLDRCSDMPVPSEFGINATDLAKGSGSLGDYFCAREALWAIREGLA
jgi:hypothetical protein